MKLFSKMGTLISTIILILIVVIVSMVLLSYFQVDMNDNDGLRVLNRAATFGGLEKEGFFNMSRIREAMRKARDVIKRKQEEAAKKAREEAERKAEAQRRERERIRNEEEKRREEERKREREREIERQRKPVQVAPENNNITIVKAIEDKEVKSGSGLHDSKEHEIRKIEAEDYATSLLLHERAHEKQAMAKDKLLKQLQPSLIE